ncbi:MAG: hypothetical protein KAW14_01955 [Candidatus Aegiribacteria sp.]|nr:hypothetical protein [Candidatus Aegiribacteria sp.]
MSELLTWLPELLDFSPWDDSTYEKLYEFFCKQIRDVTLNYLGNEVWFFREEFEDGKEKLFWHLTSRKPEAEKVPRRKKKFQRKGILREGAEREPDLRRCERLSWVNPIICNCHEPDVLDWDYIEGNRVRKTYLWLKDYSFMVILKCYPDRRRRLITSFYIDSDWTQEDFERKYRNRER